MESNNLSNKRINLIKINIEYYFVFIISILLLVLGIIMVSSASMPFGENYFNDSFYVIRRQIVWSIVSIVLLLVFTKIDYHKIAKISNFLMLIGIGLLILVLIPEISIKAGGSRRWINFIFFSVQPSELIKLIVIIYLSDILNKKYREIYKIKTLLFPPLVFILIATILIFREPDFSAAIVLWLIVFIIFYVGEVKLKHILSILSVWALFSTVYLFLEDYRTERIFAFLNKNSAQTSSNFQLRQSLIALGSGHIFGVGLGNSLQKYSYLPEANTDFIFSIIGEELGLVGTIFIVILFFMFAFFGIRIALKAKDYLGRLIAMGITSMIVIQAIMNMFISVGLIPVTGMTLPFISYGGSSLATNMISVGILLNISKYRIISTCEEE